MTASALQVDDHRPITFFGHDDDSLLAQLRAQPGIVVIDAWGSVRRELTELQPAPTTAELAEEGRWIYYPWRNTLIFLPGPIVFRRLRSDRNRNKITTQEQEQLRRLKIGVVGLSVGHAIAHTLALEGLCQELRLADFDAIELSNLNRIPATVMDLGINKAVVAARRIAELDPYLEVSAYPAGLTESSIPEFFEGLDLVIEECDSLDMKVRIRQEARRRGIPVLMETSDRGLFDVERFDQEPDRPLFHGLLGDVDPESLRGLTTRDKAPQVMRILQASQLSARMAASMVEIDRTVSTWPQLGSDVQLGAATVAAAVRRFGRHQELPSGRIRVDLEKNLDTLAIAVERQVLLTSPTIPTDLTSEVPVGLEASVIHSIRLAPSGGNVQPWSLSTTPTSVEISIARNRTSAMDVQFRGSYVAIGAAGFNARVAAAANHHVAVIDRLPQGGSADVAISIAFRPGNDEGLAQQYSAMVHRVSNRTFGTRAPLDAPASIELHRAAVDEGAELRLITDPAELTELADVLAESDRIRYLTPLLHQQMMSEIKWPGLDRLDLGIDVRTLDLDATDLAKLEVAGRPEVMKDLAAWNGGSALGDNTRDRVNACSALAVVTVQGDSPEAYLRGGSAVQRVWITAEQHQLGVQPVSPVFLYARNDSDLQTLSASFSGDLDRLHSKFTEIVGLLPSQAPILVLRLSHNAGPALRSERLPLAEIINSG